MKKALGPVRRRLRLRRGASGLCWGLALGLALAATALGLSFLTPLRQRGTLLLCCAALPVLGGFAGWLRPVSLERAARAADGCGLMARTQTALALGDRQDAMATLQRADALRALESLNIQKTMPLRFPKRPLIAAAVCAALSAALLLIPNPQDGVLRAQDRFQQSMEKPAQAIEQAAEQIDEKTLGEEAARELRRLLGDLARDLRRDRDAREALTDLSQAQRQLDRLLEEGRSAAAEALGQAGLDALAQAVEKGDAQALEDALSQASADDVAQAAQAAADPMAASALQAAAQTLAQGNAAQAAQALSQLSASQLSAGQVSAAIQSAKALAGGQGQGQGQGQTPGQGGGGQGQGQSASGGAGQGSTNREASGGASGGQSGAGGEQGRYRLGEYETIYDPTRLGDGGQISQSTGQVDPDAQLSEMTLGPGLGDASGDVPYDQVAAEYRAAAVRQAQEADLPEYARQWVTDYFTALTE